MRAILATALAKHIGQLLTVDAARAIVAEVEVDRSIDVAQFEAEEFEGYRIQCERVAGIEDELAPLQVCYAAEHDPHLMSLPFPWADLRAAERRGSVLQATARERATGRLVGYMRVRLHQRIDAFTLELTCDQFYVHPDHRATGLAVRVWGYCERAAFAVGVREATIKVNGATAAMARFFGYRKGAALFHKVAHDAADYTQAPTRRDLENP